MGVTLERLPLSVWYSESCRGEDHDGQAADW